jgi:membrane-associated phospholipid phosphatase
MNVPLLAQPTRNDASRRPLWRPSWRAITFGIVLVLYLILTLGVMFRSPVLTLDTDLFRLNLRHQYPHWYKPIYYYVMFGQRGPATLVFLPYFFWVAWRTRTTRPLVMLGVSLILLNASVGVVKLAIGRVGPRQTHNTHDILAGGDIYPSGHVSNAVVLYGLIALIAITHRKLAMSVAVFLSVTVGMGTVYLDTHWFSDVVGGWFAGALVLLALPSVMPFAQRWTDAGIDGLRRRFRRRPEPAPPAAGRATEPAPHRVPSVSGPKTGSGAPAQRPRKLAPTAPSAPSDAGDGPPG